MQPQKVLFSITSAQHYSKRLPTQWQVNNVRKLICQLSKLSKDINSNHKEELCHSLPST